MEKKAGSGRYQLFSALVFLSYFQSICLYCLQKMATDNHSGTTANGGHLRCIMLELPLGEAAATFSLEKAVCSHGLFMMAPNFWDSQSKTLQRPLRLSLDYNNPDHEISVEVRISQPGHFPQSLQLIVSSSDSLSPQQRHSLLSQVRNMLRLSDEDNKNLLKFHEIFPEAKAKGFGRVFRSPTLFEDMVKCILLCNCQWPRTLSMARSLCELQWELHQTPAEVREDSAIMCHIGSTEHFVPKTPAGKEPTKKFGVKKCRTKLVDRFIEIKCVDKDDAGLKATLDGVTYCLDGSGDCYPNSLQVDKVQDFGTSSEILSCTSDGSEIGPPQRKIGNFPSPKELAGLDETYLAKRCGLGYRAIRVLNLAKFVVEGRNLVQELEEACRNPSQCNYDNLFSQLKELDGFGPFTCYNVLMCMGFYHVIPADSETIRHLKQVHSKKSCVGTVQKDVEEFYRKFAPFQFLVYWYEVWQFYEQWFGNMSEMAPANYRLITAGNMKPKNNGQRKRIRKS